MPSDVMNIVAIERIEAFLTEQHKPVCEQTNSSISFHSPLWEDWFTVNNWLTLVIYDRGNFWIEKDLDDRSLQYDLRSLHGLVFCLAAALMFLIFATVFQGIAVGLCVSLFAFVWLYGGNMLLAWWRVPLAIRKMVKEMTVSKRG